jgi:hypothetical protein
MFHGRNDLGQRVLSGVDLMIDFATLGEYGLEPFCADGSCRERTDRRSRSSRRPGWEALSTTRRRARGTGIGPGVIPPARDTRADGRLPGDVHADWRFPRGRSRCVDFRGAVEHYAA